MLLLVSCEYKEYKIWEDYWGFKIPSPTKLIKVYDSINGAPAEGEAYYICIYNKKTFEEVKELDLWREINEESSIKLTKYINKFKNFIIEKRKDNPFVKQPINYEESEYYYFKIKDDNSFFIALLNIPQKKIYTLKWIQ